MPWYEVLVDHYDAYKVYHEVGTPVFLSTAPTGYNADLYSAERTAAGIEVSYKSSVLLREKYELTGDPMTRGEIVAPLSAPIGTQGVEEKSTKK